MRILKLFDFEPFLLTGTGRGEDTNQETHSDLHSWTKQSLK